MDLNICYVEFNFSKIEHVFDHKFLEFREQNQFSTDISAYKILEHSNLFFRHSKILLNLISIILGSQQCLSVARTATNQAVNLFSGLGQWISIAGFLCAFHWTALLISSLNLLLRMVDSHNFFVL